MLGWFKGFALRVVVILAALILVMQAIGNLIPTGQLALSANSKPLGSADFQGRFSLADVDRGLFPVLDMPFESDFFNAHADWSADGQHIAVSGEGDMYVMSIRDFQIRNVSQSPAYTEYYPIWSPDGRHIAFRATTGTNQDNNIQYHIGVLDIETGKSVYRSIANDAGVVLGAAAWSADSAHLAFATRDDFHTGSGRLEVVKIDQGQLVAEFEFSEQPPENLRWSADGKWLAFESREYQRSTENGPTTEIRQIWLMDSDTGEAHSLLKGKFNGVAWSPDSKQIAYTIGKTQAGIGYSLLMISDIETRETRQLTSIPESAYYPMWSPDGHWVAVISQHRGEESVDLFDSISGARQRLAIIEGSPSDSGGTHIPYRWSRDGRWLTVFTNYYLNNTYSVPRTYIIDVVNRSLPFNYFEYQTGFVWQPRSE